MHNVQPLCLLVSLYELWRPFGPLDGTIGTISTKIEGEWIKLGKPSIGTYSTEQAGMLSSHYVTTSLAFTSTKPIL